MGLPEVDNMAYVPAKVVDTSPWKVAAAAILSVLMRFAAGVIVPAAAFVQKGQVRLEHLEPKYKNRF